MSTISILWGNLLNSPVSKLNYRESFHSYQQTYGDVLVPYQVHGVAGKIINQQSLATWQQDVSQPPKGDYLITNLPKVKIGVLTADCQPIIFYDVQKKVIAVAHAGWRGTLAGIATELFLQLQQNFQTQSQDLQIFFGPAAGACCYEVDQKFIDQWPNNEIVGACLQNNGQRYFFDVLRYNMLCLQNCGVPLANFDLTNFACTICCPGYCSYRKFGEQTNLQLSLVELI
jgi:YfiH family protein